jgi:hypothetical protein
VILKGTLHAVGCGRYVYGLAFAGVNPLGGGATSTPRCDGNWPIDVPVPADVVGGADSVYIALYAPDGYNYGWADR